MKAHRFALIGQRLFNTPLLIHPSKAEVIIAALSERLGIARIETAFRAMEDDFDYGSPKRDRRADSGYDRVGPIAVIPVQGTLVQKLGSLRPWSGMTGYDGIRAALTAALLDPEVHGIIFDIDSPGGEAAGCFDLVDMIHDVRGRKPMASILSENAFSAAYGIGSAAKKLYVPRTGGTGSIGVIWMHVDYSRALDEDGLNVTIFKHGKRKADGQSVQPLSDEATARFQADIDTVGDIFDATVARNRRLDVRKVRGFEALTFMGPAGVDAGLADAVASPDEAFRDFYNSL